MPISLPASIEAEAERPHGSNQWIWLWEIEIQRATDAPTPPVVLRLTNRHEEVIWPWSSPTSFPPSKTWYPFNFDMTPVEEDAEGNLPQIDLSIDNTSRLVMPYLHAGEGLEGNRADAWLVQETALQAIPSEAIAFNFQIAGCIANERAATFRLELPNFFERKTPQDRFVASRCRWRFGGKECGYPVNVAAAFTTCPKTVAACNARGDDEVARNLPRLHPRRFGGFLGIPQQRNL